MSGTSIDGVLLSSTKEQIATTQNKVDECHNHHAKGKISNTKEYILYECNYIRFQ